MPVAEETVIKTKETIPYVVACVASILSIIAIISVNPSVSNLISTLVGAVFGKLILTKRFAEFIVRLVILPQRIRIN